MSAAVANVTVLPRAASPAPPAASSLLAGDCRVICNDCLGELRDMAADSIDCVITSPPYFQQRDYNGMGIGQEARVADYLSALHAVMGELIRILKPSGNIFFNLGDKISREKGALLIPHQFALQQLAARKQLRLINTINWVKKNPTPRQFTRRLVSATEPFFHFAIGEDYYYAIDEYLPEDDDACRAPVGASDKLGQKYFTLIDQSPMSAAAKQNAKSELRQVIEEARAGDIAGFRLKIKGLHAPAFGGQDGGRRIQMDKKGFTIIKLRGKKMKKDYIETSVENLRYDIKHPAVYPLKLIEELVRLGCPKGGLVLDPFCGSGTTLVAAQNNNRRAIGIDIDPEYCQLAERRLLLEEEYMPEKNEMPHG